MHAYIQPYIHTYILTYLLTYLLTYIYTKAAFHSLAYDVLRYFGLDLLRGECWVHSCMCSGLLTAVHA